MRTTTTATPFSHCDGMPLPPESDSEALALFGERHGPPAVQELDQAVAGLDASLAVHLDGIRRGDDPQCRLRNALDAIARRRVYVGRAVALRRLLKMKAVDYPTREVPDMVRVLGACDNRDPRGVLAAKIAGLEADRERADSDLANLRAAPLNGNGAAVQDQDRWLSQAAGAIARRREAEGRLAALRLDQDAATAVVGRLVGQAVEAAGGRDAVASNVVVAQVLADRFPAELAERSSRLRNLTAAVAEFGTAWSRLVETVGVHLNGPAADHLRARRAEADAALSAARAEMAGRQTDLAGELVDQAVAGVESARARIEELTGLAADAFPAGFGPAIAAARFDLAAAAELVEAMQAVA